MKTKDLHLIAFYTMKPRDPRKTFIKGYMSNPANIQYDERIGFSRGLKTKDQIAGRVILNLNKKTVVKNTYDATQTDFDALFKYFLEGYPQYVAQVMAELDVEYIKQFIPSEPEAIAPEVTTVDTTTVEATEQPSQVVSESLSSSAS